MVATNETEFVILFMEINNEIPKRVPVPIFEKTDISHRVNIPLMREWFCNTLIEEKSKLTNDVEIRCTEWSIMTNNPSAFRVYNVDFKKVLIVIGEQEVNWFFYSANDNYIEGNATLPLTWCGCCVPSHYPNIMKAIMKSITDHLQKNSSKCVHCDACRYPRAHSHQVNLRAPDGMVPANEIFLDRAVLDDNGVPQYVIRVSQH